MRIAIVGAGGAGKSTLAKRIAVALNLKHVELDALNWGPGWYNRSTAAPEEFENLVGASLSGDRWVIDGKYRAAITFAIPRMTHLIWLDYGRGVVMRRVIWRCFRRALDGGEVWPGTGNRESFRSWFDRGYPIRETWDSFERWRARCERLYDDPNPANVQKLRLRQPHEAETLVADLAARS